MERIEMKYSVTKLIMTEPDTTRGKKKDTHVLQFREKKK